MAVSGEFPYQTVSELSYAYPVLDARATLCSIPEDFQVSEILSFTLDNYPAHYYLWITKQEHNTQWIAKQLAQFAKVALKEVGYAGLKDRYALTKQWFSVPKIKQGIVWSDFSLPNVWIKNIQYHQKKLKIGALQGNAFVLRLRHVHADIAQLEQRLLQIQQYGVPNYFMQQRFGHQQNNLHHAQAWFMGKKKVARHQKGILLSAVRALLFNRVLSERIRQYPTTWFQALSGDALQLAGSHSFFIADQLDDSLLQRIEKHDLWVTAPLWGKEPSSVTKMAQHFEQQALSAYGNWQQGLENHQKAQARRAVCVVPQDFSWQFGDEYLALRFSLPAGSYATAIVRELLTAT